MKIEDAVSFSDPFWEWQVLPSWRRLHRIGGLEFYGVPPHIDGKGISLCGCKGDFTIPGVMSRLGLERCKHCCKLAQIPNGKGHPLNGN